MLNNWRTPRNLPWFTVPQVQERLIVINALFCHFYLQRLLPICNRESKCRNITANLQLMREEFLDLHGHNKVSETQLSVARSGVNGLGFSWSSGSMTFCGAPAAAAATRRSRHRDALFPGSVDVGQVDLPAWSALLPNFHQPIP